MLKKYLEDDDDYNEVKSDLEIMQTNVDTVYVQLKIFQNMLTNIGLATFTTFQSSERHAKTHWLNSSSHMLRSVRSLKLSGIRVQIGDFIAVDNPRTVAVWNGSNVIHFEDTLPKCCTISEDGRGKNYWNFQSYDASRKRDISISSPIVWLNLTDFDINLAKFDKNDCILLSKSFVKLCYDGKSDAAKDFRKLYESERGVIPVLIHFAETSLTKFRIIN